MPKKLKGETLCDFSTSIVAKLQKIERGTHWGKIERKDSLGEPLWFSS